MLGRSVITSAVSIQKFNYPIPSPYIERETLILFFFFFQKREKIKNRDIFNFDYFKARISRPERLKASTTYPPSLGARPKQEVS